ncbi:hypothetical protein [Caulobacter phage Cr30]|uniref:cysteine dioxygenase n=1 Tax=Caulobacter phage Cr30 TaxID=1357714 RepID=UPI0004A9B68B|nr:cysteine dioxygenase [Caulobacter phage Cr30]AGS81013.1 hypothetical protein [Caulobacter phage Cr30]
MVFKRKPDVVIGGNEDPYLLRWWVIPRNPFFNIYLHKFLRSDEDRALHSHPWLFCLSILIKGNYIEHTPKGKFIRKRGNCYFRFGEAWHRVQLLTKWVKQNDGSMVGYPDREPCTTIFVTGPRIREWGFACPQGFVHWGQFDKQNGCGE